MIRHFGPPHKADARAHAKILTAKCGLRVGICALVLYNGNVRGSVPQKEKNAENKERNAMFRNVIVRRPSRSMIEGITTADLGLPDYDLALRQHDQ